MTRCRTRTALAVVLTAVLAATATACSDDDNNGGGTPENVISSLGERVQTQASGALESAKAKLDEFRSGINAKDDVRIDGASPDPEGHAVAKLRVHNTDTADQKSFVILVLFKDPSGSVQDATVVTVADVAAGATVDATARSNRRLSDSTAEISSAIRY